MKVVGVIVEYNPMHNGHLHHINQAREVYQADAVIAVMSGHFLQRGEPAVVGPWYRTQMALASGADLVFELPVVFSTSSAEKFAYGSVSLLDRLGVVDELCFGSESGNIQDLIELAEFLNAAPGDFVNRVNVYHKQGYSYPRAHSIALNEWFAGRIPQVWEQPNNTLGLEYIKALLLLNSEIRPVTILRHAAGFHETEYHHPQIASATAIRKSICAGDWDALNTYMPKANADWFRQAASTGEAPITWDAFVPILRVIVMRETAETLENFAHVDEGLGNRIQSAFTTMVSPSFSDYIRQVKTKRFTWTHIQRALTSILLGITKNYAHQAGEAGAAYARVLGFNERGRHLLHTIKSHASLSVISKISREFPPGFEYDLRAGHIYQAVTETRSKSSFPIRIE